MDRNEPFTVYRDPALVGEDLDVLQPQGNVAYIHPSPHAGHTKHASLPAPRPSPHAAQQAIHVSTASNCSLSAPRSTHATHLSPPPSHTPHLLKTPSPSSQSALSSLGSHVLPAAPPHPSLPHPHLLPSLLPALSPSAALLAGHGPLGALGLTPHPLSPALLGQTALGLYPLLWPHYPNGTHPYTALGLSAAKWTHPDSAGMTEGSLKRVREVLM